MSYRHSDQVLVPNIYEMTYEATEHSRRTASSLVSQTFKNNYIQVNTLSLIHSPTGILVH